MIVIKSCKDFAWVASTRSIDNAVALCGIIEQQENDGFAVVAWENGRHVADAEGPSEHTEEHYVDAATRTGMYDRW